MIEEEALIKECLDYGAFAQRALWTRIANLATCGLACDDWKVNQPVYAWPHACIPSTLSHAQLQTHTNVQEMAVHSLA